MCRVWELPVASVQIGSGIARASSRRTINLFLCLAAIAWRACRCKGTTRLPPFHCQIQGMLAPVYVLDETTACGTPNAPAAVGRLSCAKAV